MTKCAACGKEPADGYAVIGDRRYCHGDDVEDTCFMKAVSAPRRKLRRRGSRLVETSSHPAMETR